MAPPRQLLAFAALLPFVLAQSSGLSSSASTATSAPVSSSTSYPPLGDVQTTTVRTIPIASQTFSAYPSPTATGGVAVDPLNPLELGSTDVPDFSAAWTSAHEKAKALVATFTLEEKINVSTGRGFMAGRCTGNTYANDDKGFPSLCLEDGPLSVRGADLTTVFPAGVNAAASFNRRLIRERGLLLGEEYKAKGIHIALGPMMNLGRMAAGGRNFEGFGADPYLTGEAAYETIIGMQSAGVQACAKHLVGNEQEWHRTKSSSDIDDRTMHEIYLHPFARSVMAGVTSVMCSYNLLNGTYACENEHVLNQLLKHELGFQGFVMSDWYATHSTMSAAEGLDMNMPGDNGAGLDSTYFGANLTSYVQNNTIPEARIDDMTTRIVAGYYLLQQDDPSFPAVNFDAFRQDDPSVNEHLNVQGDHYKHVRELGAASTVLLKNTNNALPLNKPQTLFIAGQDAGSSLVGPNAFQYQAGSDGVLAVGWGSGSGEFTYLVSPLDALQTRAREDLTSVSWDLENWNTTRAAEKAYNKDAAIVFINSNSGEDLSIPVEGMTGDRTNLTAWHNGDELVKAIADVNSNTIVVIHSTGPVLVEEWADHPNVTAILWAGVAGSEVGNAIADVLYGAWNPSGRLPFTVAKNETDYPTHIDMVGEPDQILVVPYTEGLLIDYRHFDTYNITPRYEFGFGLSYSTFEYDDLSIWSIDSEASDAITAWEAGQATGNDVGASTAAWLHQPAYTVSFTVTNTGALFGGDVPQLYVNFPESSGEPPAVFKGFTDLTLNPGESKQVEITLSRYDLSSWDVTAQGWKKVDGTIGITVGASSRDSRLTGELPTN
ncbi:glycoside hydrolase family 3 protein [Cylindrobasidium torrendii FP15055 ss-10]|uniref:beta-glucosidase n=1 Tax=Cylindrobasidium torrendii FP15055 ss-10 TaxID=1314674 RepID=A0A0D7B5R0_9AGAR|nr:glycoside hydrolase family 3 protein [Cylindrobasidium torrendii FP15055 ss-10]